MSERTRPWVERNPRWPWFWTAACPCGWRRHFGLSWWERALRSAQRHALWHEHVRRAVR